MGPHLISATCWGWEIGNPKRETHAASCRCWAVRTMVWGLLSPRSDGCRWGSLRRLSRSSLSTAATVFRVAGKIHRLTSQACLMDSVLFPMLRSGDILVQGSFGSSAGPALKPTSVLGAKSSTMRSHSSSFRSWLVPSSTFLASFSQLLLTPGATVTSGPFIALRLCWHTRHPMWGTTLSHSPSTLHIIACVALQHGAGPAQPGNGCSLPRVSAGSRAC